MLPNPKTLALRRALTGLLASASLGVGSAAAQDVHRDAQEYNAYMHAERSKSALCQSYVGKTVVPVPFTALAQRLSGPPSGGASGSGPVVLSIPANRDYIHLNRSAEVYLVAAGAFSSSAFSEATQANLFAYMALSRAGVDVPIIGGAKVALGSTERVLGSELARNVLGQPVRVTKVERHTRGLYLGAADLFSTTAGPDAPVAMLDPAETRTAAARAALRTALVVVPRAPYVVTGSGNGASATAQRPTHYVERSTMIVAAPKCALVLNGRSKVLDASDTAGTGG